MSEYILTHKHHTHPHAASGWRIHCGVEVTELSTNKQLSLSLIEDACQRKIACQNTAPFPDASTAPWRLSCSWPLTWPRPRGGVMMGASEVAAEDEGEGSEAEEEAEDDGEGSEA
jgi:hypothetical protein